MARSTLSVFVTLASASYVIAQGSLPTFPPTPLASLSFAYPTGVPYQAMPFQIVRGSQSGYNICNSTTENQQSQCQTAIINSISDFCLFGPPEPNSTISDTEGIEVAMCSQPGHGTRLIPNGTFTGIQVLNNANYMQIVAHTNQVNINMNIDDFGGELDPHGQDLAGNPMGGLVFSTHFSSDNTTYNQVQEWNMFIGGNITAIKICTGANAAGFCRNTLDRIGIAYNMPNNAQDGVFEVCDSDTMGLPGVYTSNGQTITYTQPAESLGAITTLPYTPVVPSSSNCVTYQSAQLFSALASVAGPTASGASTATPTPTGKNTSNGSRTSSGSSAKSTSSSSGGSAVGISLFSSILGVAFSVAFLA
jgi:hypothetical protein